jgi:hypothetical protein
MGVVKVFVVSSVENAPKLGLRHGAEKSNEAETSAE